MRTRASITSLAATALMITASAVADASVDQVSRPCAQPDSRVTASVIRGDVIYLGGRFTHVTDLSGQSQPRSRLAAISLLTCDVLTWRADANGDVSALQIVGDTLYAGGNFTSVNGTSRNRLAAVTASEGVLLPFDASVNKTVQALASDGTTLFAGGLFTSVNGARRNKLAAFDSETGKLTAWTPKAVGAVKALTTEGARVYVGGSFTSLNNDTGYAFMGAVDRTSGGLDTSFDPDFGTEAFPILALTADDRGVYAGGGGHGGHLVLWNRDGSLQSPVYQTDGGVQAVAFSGDSLYAGGHFNNYCVNNTGSGRPFICDQPLLRPRLFEVSLGSGELTDWQPRLNSAHGVFTESIDPTTHDLWFGGDFTTISGAKQARLGVFSSGD